MKPGILAVSTVLFAGVVLSRANITGFYLDAYDNGVMTCSNTDVSYIGPGPHDYQVGIDGEQYGLSAATLTGYIYTDSPGDPNLNLVHTIDNDTLTPWTDYHVAISMAQSFTFSSILVTNAGWTYTTPAGGPAFDSGSGSWIGTIDFYSGGPGTLINPGDVLGFSFILGFTGPVSFTETLTPSVPEPGALALLACGLAGLFAVQRRRTT